MPRSTADRHWQLMSFALGLLAAHLQARSEVRRANQFKHDFLATVSHELRTPLNAIIGWLHVLQSGRAGADVKKQALEAIDRNAHLQADLVGELLDASRLLQGKVPLSMTEIDIRQAIRTALDSAAESAANKGVHVDAALGGSPLLVSGDPTRLHDVASHLITNAVKFTPAGGKVRVDLKGDDADVVLRVSDTGEGISAEDLPRVFDPFLQGKTRAKRSGLGLGLAIVRELVALHGGTVTAESAGADRATFLVRIPRVNTQSGSPGTRAR